VVAAGEAAAASAAPAPLPLPTQEERRAAKVQAAQVICEYLNPASPSGWAAKLAASCSLELDELVASKASVAKAQKEKENERARKWDAIAAAEEAENAQHQFTHGAGAAAQAKKQKIEEAKKNTRAEKQLAKVNKKGMKSMMSFFGKK
jgi:hypothetical protein